MKEEKRTNKDHCASNTLKKSEHSKYHGDRTQKSSKMEGFSVGNSKYTLHSSSTDEGKSFP